MVEGEILHGVGLRDRLCAGAWVLLGCDLGDENMKQLTIEPEFRDKIPPLSADEFSKLEENILTDGEVRDPIVVWNNTIIDGHNRWAIIQKHPEIPFKIKQMEFPDKWAAIAWACKNQLGRRNLTDEQKTYLIGKQYEALKMTAGGDRRSDKFSSNQNGHLKMRTKEIVAKEHGIGSTSVQRAGEFSSGLDAAEEVSPGIREAILTGSVKATKSAISAIRNLPPEKARKTAEAIMRKDLLTAKEITAGESQKPTAKETPNPVEEGRDEFTVEDLRDLLESAVEAFRFTLEEHLCNMHLDLLGTKEGRDAASIVLKKAEGIILDYLKLVRSVKDHER